MIIVEKNEGPKIPYTVNATKVTFDDDLTINLAKREKDWAEHIDVCADDEGNLVIGAAVGRRYVAEIDIPAPMLETQKERMIGEFAQQLRYQGMSFEQYTKYTGATKDQMMDQVEPQAEQRIRSRLVLEAIAEAEKLEVTDEQYEEELQTMAEAYGSDIEKIKEDIDDEVEKMIREDLKVKNAAKFVADNAVEK